MMPVVVVAGWLLIGAIVGLVEARHGHWHKGWVVSAFFGPLAIPLAVQARRRESEVAPVVLTHGQRREGRLKVLVGFDGSATSRVAAATVVGLLGDRIGEMTLATVLDFDTVTPPHDESLGVAPDWPERTAAEESLRSLADELAPAVGVQLGTVLLAGDPPTALEAYAIEQRYDLVVAGSRGRGMTKVLFGSCAAALGRDRHGVPVLLVPSPSHDELS